MSVITSLTTAVRRLLVRRRAERDGTDRRHDALSDTQRYEAYSQSSITNGGKFPGGL